MKKFLLNVLVVGVIIVGGGLVAVVGMTIRSSKSDAESVKEKKLTNVHVQVIGTTTIEDELRLMGTVEPWKDVTLSAKTTGEIEFQGVEEGQAVTAGQELVRIETTTIKVSFDQATAQYKLAVEELTRVQEMRAQGISTPQAIDRALLDRDVALTNLRATEIKLADSVIRAKFDGIVDKLYQEEGEFVGAGTPLVRLVQLDKVKLVIGIPERDIAYFQEGDAVGVTLDALPGRHFEGRTFRIATTGELSTHTFPTEVALDNPDGALRPGMIAQARFVRESFADSILAPAFTVITTDSGRHVFVEEGGYARRRPVELGLIQEEFVHVKQGLSPGERLIVVGQRELMDGEAIDVKDVLQ